MKAQTIVVVVAACTVLGGPLDGAVTIFPNDAVVNIQQPPYSVNATDNLDDTIKIRQAIEDHLGTGRIIYFPSGTYHVSDTLLWRKANTGSWSSGWRGYLSFQGQDKATTVIKLRPGSFTDPATPKAVIYTGSQNPQDAAKGSGNEAFNHYVRNLSIVTGTNNAGAIGIDFLANNRGGLFDVDVRSEGGTGVAGISMKRSYIGPCLLKNVSVTGFSDGITMADQVDSVTCENIALSGQTAFGIYNSGQCLTIRNITSVNAVPAVHVPPGPGFTTVLNGKFTGGSTGKYAINNVTDGLYARAVSSSGYTAVIRQKNVSTGTSNIAEYVSNPPPHQLFDSPPRSLHLPVEETPTFHTNTMGDWANVRSSGAIPDDGLADTAAIQAAMNSGKSTIYFPTSGTNGVASSGYHINDTITVPSTVRRIIGMESHVKVTGTAFSNAGSPRAVFHFTGTTPVIVESITLRPMTTSPGAIWLGQANPVLTVKSSHIVGTVSAPYANMDATPRKLFLEDTVGGNWTFSGSSLSVWARQFNMENASLKSTNDGAKLWVLGIKTEKPGTVIRTQAAGKTELLGGLLYTATTSNIDPAFASIDSSQSLVFGSSAYAANQDYPVLITETRSGLTNSLLHNSPGVRPRASHGIAIPLFVGYPLPAYYTNFTGSNNTTPAGWNFLVGNPSILRIISNDYQYENVGGASPNARVVYGASAGWSDYTVTSNVRADILGSHLGVMARVQGPNDYYVAYLLGSNEFRLARFRGGAIQTLAYKLFPTTPYVAGERWKISLRVQGSQITASLYNSLGNPMADLSAYDPIFTFGSAGIKGVCNPAGKLIWEDFEIRQE